MAKKMTIAEFKAGLFYRCVFCDKKCDDEYSITSYNMEDVYMGRVNVGVANKSYYCSKSCQRAKYRENMSESMQHQIESNQERLPMLKVLCRQAHKCGETMDAFMLEIKHNVSYTKLLQGCISRLGEYALHEMRLKFQMYNADIVEYYHQDIHRMNEFLTERHYVDILSLDAY